MADYDTIHPIRLRPVAAAPVQIRHLPVPPRIEKPKKIHRRHLLPRVREGVEREFHSTTPPLALAAAPRGTGTDISLVGNIPLLSPGQQSTASSVGEPSLSVNGNVVFYTGNWYAAVSSNGGQNFSFINPAEEFANANPPGSAFCCDQVVQYIKALDMFVWLQQYGPDTGNNIQRIAFAKSADVADGRWTLFDLTTDAINVPGAFMDFPDLAVGATCLYMTTNVFMSDAVGSAVVRLPFDGIASGDVRARPFVSMDFQSFRVAQQCGATAFFAAHRDTSTLEVFTWDESKDAPVSQSVGVSRWIGGNSGYQSRTPDGNRWLDRADPRLTGAALAGNEVWFCWGVDSGSNQRTKPFVQMARIDATNLTLIENVNIFDTDSATCYGGLATNADGEVGISYMIGGGSRFPSHVVGIVSNDRKFVTTSVGERAPLDGQWGDYLTARRAFPNERLFVASGLTMLGAGNGSNRDATPRFVTFGRSSVVSGGGGGGTTTTTGGTTGGGTTTTTGGTTGNGVGGTTGAGTGAFTDVNTLPVVSAAVAQQVLNAARAAGATQADEPVPLRFVNPEKATQPGVERWPVKTGQDPDIAQVGKNILNGTNLGAGIVPATIADLIRIQRPPDMLPVTKVFPAYQNKRRGPVEWTVWQIEGQITVLKMEDDGDYHLVVQGPTGDTLIAEVPTPTKTFIGTSPWLANIQAARQAVDTRLVAHLSPRDFVPLDGVLVPVESVSEQRPLAENVLLPQSFVTPPEGQENTIPVFQTRVNPTPARITGVGFFDADHGQTGVARLNGFEIHPVLKIEWL
jgi:hypothetical protein